MCAFLIQIRDLNSESLRPPTFKPFRTDRERSTPIRIRTPSLPTQAVHIRIGIVLRDGFERVEHQARRRIVKAALVLVPPTVAFLVLAVVVVEAI